MKRLLTTSLWAIAAAASAVIIMSLGQPVHALDGDDFKAGKIISDSNFFNDDALSPVQIQQFLESKVPTCDTDGSEIYSGSTTRAEYGADNGNPPPYTCMKSYKRNVPNKVDSSGYCDDIAAAEDRSAAQIIDIVSQSCGVSAKVILVLLQKEQSLVTDDWPWESQYRKATGFGCPDTNLPEEDDSNDNGCYDAYEGFFKQVYYGARQYIRYARDSNEFNHIAGATNFIRYHPNTGCGGKNVFIENQATAGLYNYTPYQPNAAALNNLYGTGNSCSAYGNRNFWRLYNDWFGDSLSDPLPSKVLVGDWDGDGDKTIGLKFGNQFYLDNNNDGTADITFGMGKIADKAFVGDWDGDGEDSIGLKRGEFYYLDNNNDGDADIHLTWGRPTDQIFVGNWDGDINDELGLRRGNVYYLDVNTNAKADIKFGIGRVTDRSFVGDWNDNGIDSIGLRRGDQYFLDNNNDNLGDINFGIGRPTDQVFVGDWDGDGSDTIGLKRDNFYYLVDDDDREDVIKTLHMGKASDNVVVGNWDGDAVEEIGLQRYNRYYYDTDLDGASEVQFTFIYF